MMMVCILLLAIVCALIFGPFVAGLFALLVAVAGSAIAAIALLALALVGSLFGLGAAGWALWWLFDRRSAMAGLRQAQTGRRQD